MSRWGASVTFDWLLILLCFATADRWSWCAPLIVFPVGILQHAIGILGHEGAHRTGSRISDWLTCLFCLWPVGVGINGYRRFHFAHHKHLNDPDRDPEQVHRLRMSGWQWRTPCGPWKRAGLFVLDHLGLGLLEISKALRIIPRYRSDYLSPGLLIGSAILFSAYWPTGLLWHLSLVTSFWAVFRLRIWTEHVGSESGTHETVRPKWWRSWYQPHGTWMHAEHHARPGVPFQHLRVGNV